MWQRVQTLYIAIATILIGTMFFSAKAVVPGADGSIAQTIDFTQSTPYVALLVIISILNVLALMGYKILVFQLRTAMFSALMTLALQIWLVIDFVFTHSEVSFKVAAIFPLIAIILDILAVRGILADQFLVKNSEHLRKPRKRKQLK